MFQRHIYKNSIDNLRFNILDFAVCAKILEREREREMRIG